MHFPYSLSRRVTTFLQVSISNPYYNSRLSNTATCNSYHQVLFNTKNRWLILNLEVKISRITVLTAYLANTKLSMITLRISWYCFQTNSMYVPIIPFGRRLRRKRERVLSPFSFAISVPITQ